MTLGGSTTEPSNFIQFIVDPGSANRLRLQTQSSDTSPEDYEQAHFSTTAHQGNTILWAARILGLAGDDRVDVVINPDLSAGEPDWDRTTLRDSEVWPLRLRAAGQRRRDQARRDGRANDAPPTRKSSTRYDAVVRFGPVTSMKYRGAHSARQAIITRPRPNRSARITEGGSARNFCLQGSEVRRQRSLRTDLRSVSSIHRTPNTPSPSPDHLSIVACIDARLTSGDDEHPLQSVFRVHPWFLSAYTFIP